MRLMLELAYRTTNLLTRETARSALPDAPVVTLADQERPRRRLRQSTARALYRLANRI
jgi:hypothetical protein